MKPIVSIPNTGSLNRHRIVNRNHQGRQIRTKKRERNHRTGIERETSVSQTGRHHHRRVNDSKNIIHQTDRRLSLRIISRPLSKVRVSISTLSTFINRNVGTNKHHTRQILEAHHRNLRLHTDTGSGTVRLTGQEGRPRAQKVRHTDKVRPSLKLNLTGSRHNHRSATDKRLNRSNRLRVRDKQTNLQGLTVTETGSSINLMGKTETRAGTVTGLNGNLVKVSVSTHYSFSPLLVLVIS